MKLIDAYMQMTIQAVTTTRAMSQGRVPYDYTKVRDYETCMVMIYNHMCLDGPDAPLDGETERFYATLTWSD